MAAIAVASTAEAFPVLVPGSDFKSDGECGDAVPAGSIPVRFRHLYMVVGLPNYYYWDGSICASSPAAGRRHRISTRNGRPALRTAFPGGLRANASGKSNGHDNGHEHGAAKRSDD